MAFCEHTSKALAASSVHFPDVHAALVRAHDNPTRRLEELEEAKAALTEILEDVDAALAIERALAARKKPTLVP